LYKCKKERKLLFAFIQKHLKKGTIIERQLILLIQKQYPLDLQSGYPYSLVRYGLPYNYPRLDRSLNTDVIVLGAGISGALTAYHLSKAGIPAVVLDGRTIGLGSTCGSTSLLQYEIDVPLTELKEKIGEKQAAMAYILCHRSIGQLEQICHKLKFPLFEKKHSLYLASYKKDKVLIEKEYAARKALGFEVEYWEEDKIKKRMGFSSPGAIYSHTAAQTDAYMLTHALHQHNIKKDIAVFDKTAALDITHQRNGVTVETTEGYKVKAKFLVIATGYEAIRYIKEPLIKLNSTYAVVSEALPQEETWYQDCLIWETKDPYLYMRKTSDNRILVGGRDEEFYNPSRRDKLIAKKAKELERDFSHKFPSISFIPEFRWTGTFAATDDGLPFIGNHPKMPHTLFALGFGGNGITFSQIAAEMITDIITGKKNKAAAIFAFGR
jgi:glycine/D-amino acid oxidase-like deaminating enzyme